MADIEQHCHSPTRLPKPENLAEEVARWSMRDEIVQNGSLADRIRNERAAHGLKY